MSTNQPQNLSEWQLYCVLKRTNLLQYYDRFIRQGECDVLMLYNAEDEKFKEVIQKVGMAKKPLHVRQFRNSLLEWMKDPGGNEHLPSYIKKADDTSLSPVELSVKCNVASGDYSEVPLLKKDIHLKQTEERRALTVHKSEKKEIRPQQKDKLKPPQRLVKDHKQHALYPYYDDLMNNTVLDKMVLDDLISRCIIMIEDREEIIKPTTQSDRNKVLLNILTERPYGTLEVLKEVLKESDPHNSDVQELVGMMQGTESSYEHISCPDIIFHAHIVMLQKCYKMFVNDIDCKTDIADNLYEADVLNTEEKEDICNSLLTRHDSNRMLLNKLFRKGEDAYKHLLNALRHGKYDDIASDMEKIQISEQEIQFCQIGIKKLRERQMKKDHQVIHTQIEALARRHDGVIPEHILEQFERRLKIWSEDDKTFVNTAAEKQVMKSILIEGCVTIVGNSGTGKSFIARHVALKMMEHGYIIIPCDSPVDIRQWFTHGRKTLFVFDDVCGRYTLDQQIFCEWKQRLEHIQALLVDKCCKIISTCRLDVYKVEELNSLPLFNKCNIDLGSPKFRLSAFEKSSLAEMYFKDNADIVKELSEKYDFFPLLCSLFHKKKLQQHVNITIFFNNPFDVFENELVELYRIGDAGKLKYCGLVLCVMFNNTLKEEHFSNIDTKTRAVIEDVVDKCELNKGISMERFKKSLETLKGTYVVKEDSTYKIIHDKMFDFLAKIFGEKMIQLFIDHANSEFIKERFIWKTIDNLGTDTEFAIKIPDDQNNRYMKRLLKDWKGGLVNMVFLNRNMKSSAFTKTFVNNISKLDHSMQEEIAGTRDIYSKDTALRGSCIFGSVELVKWLISRKSDIYYCGEDGWFPLLWASQEGHVDVVRELLQHKAGINQCNNYGVSPLFIASQNGHAKVVDELLQNSAKVNQCDNYFVSPLYIASSTGHVDVVKQLLNHSADVNQCLNNGFSPLVIACKEGNVEVIKVLLQQSANVNNSTSNDVRKSPLFQATRQGHVDVVELLLQYSAEVTVDSNGVSALSIASKEGYVDVVKALLQHSADVNSSTNDGASPLSIASKEGYVDIVKALLQHSADVNSSTNDGASPLFIASYNGHVDIVKELLLHSGEVNQCDKDGTSPLIIASQEGHANVVKELLQHVADANQCNKDGVSPLCIASQEGNLDVVKELLHHSADINLCDDTSVSPLFIASQNGHIDVVKELIRHSAQVNICNNNGASPLFIASQNGHANVVKILLQHSADGNKCRNNGITPLLIASYNNRIEVVRVLLQCGDVDIDICDNEGYSPLFIANQQGHVGVVKELLHNSANVSQFNCNGVFSLQVPQENEHLEEASLLLGKGEIQH